MVTPAPPSSAAPLTVWLGSKMYTFAPGREVTIGRSEQADIRVDAPGKQAISRIHAVLSAQGPEWVVIDKSRNGIYLNGGTRATNVVVSDDTAVALGAPEGPCLTFRVTSQQVPAARSVPPASPVRSVPPTAPARGPQQSGPPPAAGGPRPSQPPGPPHRAPQVGQPPRAPMPVAGPQSRPPGYPAGPPPAPGPIPPRPTGGPVAHTGPGQPPRPAAPSYAHVPVAHRPVQPEPEPDLVGRLTGVVKKALPARPATAAPPGARTVGRSASSDIVVDDALASRVHAFLVQGPAGIEIRDNASSNGIFVNGNRVAGALLTPGDVVTIGNTDLSFTGATLVPRQTSPQTGGLQASQIGLTIDGHQLLSNVSIAARPGTLTAVIGPSGAGKSTFSRILSGANVPSTGVVTFDGHNVHAEYASLRSRIGMVPQDDVVHRQLTVQRALSYAAELRLPPDTSRKDRRAVVDRVLSELELTEHRDKRVDTLSGGQRKRVSVAMELLTGPSLLILDEPTSGLDKALDRQVMAMLRRLADAGRVVIVVTHSLDYLDVCDEILLLAPGGKTAYYGPPAAIARTMGTSDSSTIGPNDWADIYTWVANDPDGAHRFYLSKNPAANQPPPPAAPPGPLGEPAHTSRLRQILTLARRQVRLIFADRGYFVFLALLPFILGALSLAVPGDVGLGKADVGGDAPSEPNQLLILLNIAAVFMGTALTIRDLVGERPIFRREQAVGLFAGTYMTAKIVIYSVAAALQVAVLTAIVVAGKGGPTQGAVLLGNPVAELYVSLALTAIVSAIVGLALSSLARTNEWILPMLVVVIMLSIVFSGGMIPVTGRVGLDQVSWLLPARWGFAASASTIDLLAVAPLMTSDDVLWRHQPAWWLLDMGMLLVLGLAAIAVVRWRLRLPAHTGAAGSGQSGMPGWVVGGGALLLVAALIAGLTVVTRDSGTRSASPVAGAPAQGPAPDQKPVDAAGLPGLLLAAGEVADVMGVPGLSSAAPVTVGKPRANTATPPECTGAVDPANQATYRDANFTGLAGQVLTDTGDPKTTVEQFVVSFVNAEDAARFHDAQNTAWMSCASTTVTLAVGSEPAREISVGALESPEGQIAVELKETGRACQRSLSSDSNVVIDIKTCTPSGGQQAQAIASKIAERIG